MTSLITPALLQAAPARDAVAVAADVATVIVAVAVVLAAVVGTALLIRIHGLVDQVRSGVHQNFGPVSDRARAISDNVEYVTQVVRSDVEGLDASVKALSARLTQASELMEERIEEFNALIEVVQREAEGIFIDTASTVRGVRAGAQSITARRVGGGDPDRAPGADRSDAAAPPEAPATAVTGARRRSLEDLSEGVAGGDAGVDDARDAQD
jgi:hypothetical protein